jgi:afadin
MRFCVTSQLQPNEITSNAAANDANTSMQGSFKRKLSKREKKDLKKKEKEQKSMTNLPIKENGGIAQQLYRELPESSFTRSISNPELVMRKRRQLKLEKKLQQIRSSDGGPDSGESG